VRLDAYNRYFIQQTLGYESGAVIRLQSDGMVLMAEPTFDISLVNNSEEITLVMISMLGLGSMQGTTTEGVYAKVVSVSTDAYSRVHTNVYINHTTPFGLGWYSFYNSTLSEAFGITPDKYNNCVPADPLAYCYTRTQGGPYGILKEMIRSPYFRMNVDLNTTSMNFELHLILKNRYDFLNHDPPTMPIKTLRIMKVFVNMAVGGLGAEVNI
jgi:hypothetical protein